jgi:hypothetical protein
VGLPSSSPSGVNDASRCSMLGVSPNSAASVHSCAAATSATPALKHWCTQLAYVRVSQREDIDRGDFIDG